jgi:hypothetical protein
MGLVEFGFSSQYSVMELEEACSPALWNMNCKIEDKEEMILAKRDHHLASILHFRWHYEFARWLSRCRVRRNWAG